MNFSEFNPAYLALEDVDGIVVARFTVGRLSDEDNIDQLGHEMFAIVEKYNCSKVILCLDNVQFITSSALGKLITLHRKLHRHEGKLILCGVGGTVEMIMQSTRLINYFHFEPTLDRALATMQAA